MGQTLTHGIYLPDEGERNCYNGLADNWQLLDGAVGTIAEHTSALASKAPLVHTHTKSDITDLFNSNFIPSANNSYDLGSSSYQWNNLYSKNYYYNGVAWGLDKANEWTDNQTTTGAYYVKSTTWEKGVEPSSSSHKNIYFADKNNISVGTIRRRIANGSQSFQFFGSASVKNGQLDPTGDNVTWGFSQVFLSNGSTYFQFDGNIGNSIIPRSNNTFDLGSSTLKWKTLNGINPGALSLPGSNYDNISTQNWVKRPSSSDGGFMCNIVPSVNGWICIQVSREKDFGVWVIGTFRQSFRAVQTSPSTYVNMLFFPALAGSGINIYTNSVETDDADLAFNIARIYPCLGNV